MSSVAYRIPFKSGESETGYSLIALLVQVIRARVLNAMVRAIGSALYQVSNKLAAMRAFLNGTHMPVPSLCVVSGAVQSEFAVLMHTDPRLLVPSVAGALVLLACISLLEVSQIALKTHQHEA